MLHEVPMDTRRAELLVRRFRSGYIAEQEVKDFCGLSDACAAVQVGTLEQCTAAMQLLNQRFKEFCALVITPELQQQLPLLDPTTMVNQLVRLREFTDKLRLMQRATFEDGEGI